MDEAEARHFISQLYEYVLRRAPEMGEFEHWVGQAMSVRRPSEIVQLFGTSAEYKQKTRVQTEYAPGHYHSPIVDPAEVADYVTARRLDGKDGLAGIFVPWQAMADFWSEFEPHIERIPFCAEPTGLRYHYNNGYFSYGDAISLFAQFLKLRPKTVVEIGSGFSSACMLDAADFLELETKFHFIEPDAARLRNLLRKSDLDVITIEERKIQTIPLRFFEVLQENDIIFIDSTHVLKTGSDVHYEICNILPSLHPGVIIHFHDIHFPFEYPDSWIFCKNKSWNENYAVRLFLAFNNSFEINFWGSAFAQADRPRLEKTCPRFLINPGGSLWIQKTR